MATNDALQKSFARCKDERARRRDVVDFIAVSPEIADQAISSW
jgi:hypothetical protein